MSATDPIRSAPPSFSDFEQSIDAIAAEITRPFDPRRDAVILATMVPETEVPAETSNVRRRRIGLPVVLFLATCASTFWVGAAHWHPEAYWLASDASGLPPLDWRNGLTYMAAVIGILLLHEMGHFVQTLRHRIPSSLPFFIPIPISLFGTMGAVIGMDGLRANRRQLFDIGISGPIAGLLLAVPITWHGILLADHGPVPSEDVHFHSPLLIQLLVSHLRPDMQPGDELALNPYLVAGWVGLLITGLNMLPISQLDGGHVIYALFGKRAHLISGGFLVAAIMYVLLADAHIWAMMLILVILIGVHHPPTSNDRVPLGPLRWAIGVASLAIPILCFPPQGITFN